MIRTKFFTDRLQHYIPAVKWLSEYSLRLFRSDSVSGITLAAYAIPVSLAYATLAAGFYNDSALC